MNIRTLAQLVMLSAGMATLAPAHAAGYTFTSMTDWWGGATLAPAFDGKTVVLSYDSNVPYNSITAISVPTGDLTSVVSADSRSGNGTIIPGTTVGFTRIGPPSVSNGAVAFAGMGGTTPDNSQFGIYSYVGGKLATVANRQTPVPGASGTFNYFDEKTVMLSGSTVVFSAADNNGKWGVYRYQNNQLGLLVNADTPPPAVPNGQAPNFPFGYFSDIDYKNGQLAFQSGSGIYLQKSDGSITTIAGMNSPLPSDHPNGAQAIAMFDVNLAGNDVVFKWWSDYGVGLYRWNETTGISAVVDRIAGRPGLGDVTTDAAGNLAFELGQAIYTGATAGSYQRLIGADDSLDGKSIWGVDMGSQSLGDGTLAFKAYFKDGSTAFYLATPVPEPETYAMFLAGLGLMGVIARRKKQGA